MKKILKEITDFSIRNNIKENNVKTISNEINKLNQQIEQLNKEKEQFLILSNDSNKEKKEMEIKLSSVIYKYERTNAIIKESQYYLNQTNQKEKNNLLEQQMQYQKLKEYEEQSNLVKKENRIGRKGIGRNRKGIGRNRKGIGRKKWINSKRDK